MNETSTARVALPPMNAIAGTTTILRITAVWAGA
jgi:hypothetical protein